SSITVIDAESNTVAGTIALEGVRYPYTVSVSPDRTLLALAVPGFDMSSGHLGHEGHAASTRGYVVLLDALTGERRMATRLSAANHNVAFLPGTGHEVWSSQATQPGSTVVMDTTTLSVQATLRVGESPSNTTFSPDGRIAFVANTSSA